MNSLRSFLLVLTLLSWPSFASTNVDTAAQPASQTSTTASSVQQQSATGAKGQEQKQSAEAATLFQTAFDLYRKGKFDEALANCTKATTRNPNDFRPHALAGYIYMEQMKMKSASEAFANAIRLQPTTKEFYLAKAAADTRRGAIDEAIAACRKALEIDPNYAEAYATIGETLHYDEKRRAEAIAAFESALKINPALLPVYESLGGIFIDAKDEKRAEEVFRQGLAADPKHMAGRFPLGRLLVKQGKLVEARELWEGRSSDEDRAMPNFIELLKRAENLKRATDTLAQKPNDPDALIDMGLAVMDGDSWVVDSRQKRAIVLFRKALELKPNYAKAQYNIVKAYVQIADTFSAEKKNVDRELVKLRQLDPALAREMEEYRKNYTGGLTGTPIKYNQ